MDGGLAGVCLHGTLVVQADGNDLSMGRGGHFQPKKGMGRKEGKGEKREKEREWGERKEKGRGERK